VSHVENYARALADFENMCLTDVKFAAAIQECSEQSGNLNLRRLLRRTVDHIWKYISFLETVLTRCTDSGASSQSSTTWRYRSIMDESHGELSAQDVSAVRECMDVIHHLINRMQPW
jgi:hypothetical protein